MTHECAFCERTIVFEDDEWIDPNATGEDAVWRFSCDGHDTFIADHQPKQ